MDTLLQDARYALRRLARAPGFAFVAVLTLALGIGANAAIFTLLDQVLLRPLPVLEPGRLVLLHGPGPRSGMNTANKLLPTPLSYPMFVDFRDKGDAFSGVLAYYPLGLHVEAQGGTERIDAELVSGSYFEVLGLRPAAGRLLSRQDDVTPGGHPLAVLSHAYWTRRFGSEASVVGQVLLVNGTPLTVIGVAPRGYRGAELGGDPALFVPLAMKAQMTPTWDRLQDRRAFWLTVMARLKPGMTREQATAASNVLYRQILEEEVKALEGRPESLRKRFVEKRLELLPGSAGASGFREAAQAPLAILMGMVGLVLLIACANVANLLLAQASRRQKEIAVRLSIGASRTRLVRQLLVESLVLAVMGGLGGLLLGAWSSRLLVETVPDATARSVLSAEVDPRVLAFSGALCLLTALLTGLVPAIQATRPSLVPALKEGAAAVAGTGPGVLRKGLVVAQVSLSLLLLIGAGLLSRSLANLRAVDLGFAPDRLLSFAVNPSLNGYSEERKQALFEELRDALATLPEARAVAFAENPVIANSSSSSTISVDGYTAKEGEDMNPHLNSVGPGYFAAMQIPLLAGRDFDARDRAGAPLVAVVNESFARYFFGTESPLGRRFKFGRGEGPFVEIVGLVRDSKTDNLRDSPRFLYLPFRQAEHQERMTYYVRARGDEGALAAGVRAAVARVDAALPVYELKTMWAQIDETAFPERLVAFLSSAFGVLATLLAALGLYGVMSLSVGQRNRELGVRMAMGATPRDILGLVLSEVARLLALGVGIGLPAGLGAAHLLRAQLFGLSPYDPATLGLVVLALAAAALLAGYAPAARAARIDPMASLRCE
jgi:predicted permease